MNIIDALIIVMLIVGAISGFKAGVLKKTVSLVGLIVIIILSFIFKNYLSMIMYENLPFLKLWGAIKGIEVLNILFYEIISFLIIFTVLSIIYKVIVTITGLVEKVLKATVLLAIPSKLLGIIIGVLEYYIITYIILFVLTQPVFNIKEFNDSKWTNKILTETPVISKYADETLSLYDDIYKTIDSYNENNKIETNEKILIIFLENKIITAESTDKLIEQKKIEISDRSIIDKYRKKEIQWSN